MAGELTPPAARDRATAPPECTENAPQPRGASQWAQTSCSTPQAAAATSELYLRAMNEADWMSNVIRVAKDYGWRVYHGWLSARSEAGWPDLVLVRERIVFIELKAEGKPLTAAQRAWADALREAGAEVYAPAYPSEAEQLYAALVMRVLASEAAPGGEETSG